MTLAGFQETVCPAVGNGGWGAERLGFCRRSGDREPAEVGFPDAFVEGRADEVGLFGIEDA